MSDSGTRPSDRSTTVIQAARSTGIARTYEPRRPALRQHRRPPPGTRLAAVRGAIRPHRRDGRIVLAVDLTPRTLLRLAPGLRVRFDEAGHVLVDAPNGGVVDIGPRGFAALSLFSQPLALGDAIERLEADERRPTEFVPTLNALNMLLEEG